MKSKKRAPRLPGHLARSEGSFTSCQSVTTATDTFAERPTSRCSNYDADSIYSQDVASRDSCQKEQWCRPTHDSLRPTLSPLLHSAIVHGVTPKARVKGAERAPEAPSIKSVLGFHSEEPESSPSYWPADSSYSPARCRMVAPAPPRTLAASSRMPLHGRGDSRPCARQPLYTSGDLVWYQHPSGPWIAGRIVGLELLSRGPQYAVLTVEDGVRRTAQEPELQLRTSGQLHPAGSGLPAEIIEVSSSFEGLQVLRSDVNLQDYVRSCSYQNSQSTDQLDMRSRTAPKEPATAKGLGTSPERQRCEQVARDTAPHQRQSCDLEGSGLERLRAFSSPHCSKNVDKVEEDRNCNVDQNTSQNSQAVCGVVPSRQSSMADPLSVPVWQNTHGETRKQLPDFLASPFTTRTSFHPVNSNSLSSHSLQQDRSQACNVGHQDSLFEPATTPSTLRSPSDNGLMHLSSTAFSPTNAIINSALENNDGSQANWQSQTESAPANAPYHARKPSHFGADPLQNMFSSSNAHADPLRFHISQSSVAQAPLPHGGGALFAPDMSAEESPKALFTPNMVPVNCKYTGIAVEKGDENDDSVDSAEAFTPCMSTPGTTLSSQAGSDGIPTRIPSMSSTGGRTLSGIFRTCVSETLGFGSASTDAEVKKSISSPVQGVEQQNMTASDDLDLSLPQPPELGG